MPAERVDALVTVAGQRGWRADSLRTAVDVVSSLLGRAVGDACAMSWLDGEAGGELEHDGARAIEDQRRRAVAWQEIRSLVGDLRVAADRLDESSGRDLAGEVEAWLLEHGPATAATVARGVGARNATVRELLADERFCGAERPPGSAPNARHFQVRETAATAGPVARTGIVAAA